MDWLNYHHLLYFWTVVREGGVARASKSLRLAQPTISGQVRALEAAIGHPLLERRGRTVVPTDYGRLVYRYADEIFGLGRELMQTCRGTALDGVTRLVIGTTESMPKMVAGRVLEPILEHPRVHLVVHEGRHDDLVADLARHRLDLVLSDAPIGRADRGRAFSHALGDSGTSILAAPGRARELRRGFPRSLIGAPMILPDDRVPFRRELLAWFEKNAISPRVVAEVGDSALLKVLAARGVAAFATPTAVESEVIAQYGVALVGRLDEVREQYYLISSERRLKNPVITELVGLARSRLFVRAD